MLTEITLAGYGPIKEEITLRPTPLHALIGPNDSGKSSILNATAMAKSVLKGHAVPAEVVRPPAMSFRFSSGAHQITFTTRTGYNQGIPGEHPEWLLQVVLFRPWAYQLKRESELVPELDVPSVLETGGLGLPGMYDLMLGRLDGTVESISSEVSKLFPSIARIGLNPVNRTDKEIVAYLRDGSRVPARNLSDGVVFFLAFAALRYTTGIKTILLEEPENGLHPSRIRDVMKVLRATSEAGIQIILTTHSPLVLNELKPEEVTIVTRDREKGTQVWPMLETPFFKARFEEMTLGEIWLAYCDGDQETELVQGVQKP